MYLGNTQTNYEIVQCVILRNKGIAILETKVPRWYHRSVTIVIMVHELLTL